MEKGKLQFTEHEKNVREPFDLSYVELAQLGAAIKFVLLLSESSTAADDLIALFERLHEEGNRRDAANKAAGQ